LGLINQVRKATQLGKPTIRKEGGGGNWLVEGPGSPSLIKESWAIFPRGKGNGSPGLLDHIFFHIGCIGL